MKKTFLLAALTTAALVSCGPDYKESAAKPGSEIAYSMSFIKNVVANVDANENLVISPYSAGVALSMLAEGSAEQTKAEFEKALNGCVFKAEDLGGNDTVIVNSANSLWLDDNFTLKEDYVSTLKKDYFADAYALDFTDPATVKAINKWCADNTNEKITDIIDRLGPSVVMVLANALYFNAPWLDPFDKSFTAKADFNGSVKKTEVDMMYRKAVMNYAEYQGCQLVQLPYKGGRYSMYVLLPPAGMNINDAVSYLSEEAYNVALKSLAPQEVLLRMPKAKLETSIVLNETLKDMGVESAFSASADFTGMADKGQLVLDQVKQKCFVEISEQGTEAAAVTVAQVRLTSAREPMFKTMTVNRPYMFFIADNENILFAGKVMNL